MEIHKPKPWHGWREFLKEIGTIVVGVLIALGAEQAVEWAHREHEVVQARAALHDEVGRDMTVLIREAREDRCMAAMLDKLATWAKGGPKPPYSGDLLSSVRSSVWDVARTGSVPNMALKERLALAAFYGQIDNQQVIIQRTRDLMTDLRGFLNLDTLSPIDRQELLKAVGRARPNFAGEAANIPVLLAQARALGASPGPPIAQWDARVDEFCREAGAS